LRTFIKGFSLQSKEIEVDEDLPNFYKTITVSEAEEVILSNDRMKTRYGFEFQDPDTIERLSKIRTTP
jgi:hypothetical protein